MYFELDNDDMELLKCHSIFILLIFIQKCFTKTFHHQKFSRNSDEIQLIFGLWKRPNTF